MTPTLTPGGNPSSRTGHSTSLAADGSAIAAAVSSHPLESRLLQWNATQRAFKLEKIRRIHGAAEPIRREMESLIVSLGEWTPQQLGGSARVHGDILEGKEMAIDWNDIFRGMSSMPLCWVLSIFSAQVWY